jgi:hypothetical protein
MLIGFGALLWGVNQWAMREFGPLNLTSTMRAVILAMTFMVCGFQLMMSGFMSSIINIPIYERRISDAPPDQG